MSKQTRGNTKARKTSDKTSKSSKSDATKTAKQRTPEPPPIVVVTKSKEDEAEDLLCVLRAAFDSYDLDRKGYIQTEELCKLMKTLGQTLPSSEIEKLIESSDVNLNLKFSDVVTTIKPAKLETYDRFNKDGYPKLSTEEFDQMKTSFAQLDKDGLGFIKANDLKNALKFLGQTNSEKDLDNLMSRVDPSQKGMVTFDRFVLLMDEENKRKRMEQLQKTFREWRKAFDLADEEKVGVISIEDVKKSLRFLGEASADKKLKEILHFIDLEGHAEINYTEFTDIVEGIKYGVKMPDLTPENIEDIEDVFNVFDTNKNGQIRVSELGFAMSCLKLSMDEQELFDFIASNGLDPEGYIRLYRFKVILEPKLKELGDLGVEGNKLSDEEIADLKEVFAEFDDDGDGVITVVELGKIMESLGRQYSQKKLKEILASADEDGSGSLEFPEMVALMEKHMRKSRFLDEMRRAFHHFDNDENGYISPRELKKALGRMSVKLGKLEFIRMLNRVDTDRDGQISFKEFVVMMLSDMSI